MTLEEYLENVLWIAFRLYLWPTEHNAKFLLELRQFVVNCFQIVSLTYWAQPNINVKQISSGCELLSDCIFDLLSTTVLCVYQPPIRCELLSDCIFDLLSTTLFVFIINGYLLWIAFRLYLWPTEHNKFVRHTLIQTVVNCFQIVSLTYWAQPKFRHCPFEHSCELLSDCIFDLLSTTANPILTSAEKLWIAFRLYLWPTEHNDVSWYVTDLAVVNCFQIVSLTYWAQLLREHGFNVIGCELLSDCIFDLLSTTRV